MDTFDYVVVGGGTGGCVVSGRLAAGTGTVCLLEAGPSDSHPLIQIPAGFFKLVFDSPLTWGFESEPGPHTAGRRLAAPQGRVLGGTSSINGMIYNRGQASDFNTWAQLGNRGWSFDDVLPYFMKSERRIGSGDSSYRGTSGPIPVRDMPWDHELCDAFIDAAVAEGIPRNSDYNGDVQFGVSRVQSTMGRWRRMSAARAFLHPARRKGNIEVRTAAQVERIIIENRRAVGVSYRIGEKRVEIRARREVIVSCGTLNTPKVLQLSGLGPAELLNKIGIDVVEDLPGVGANLRDHYGGRLVARVKPGVKTINAAARAPGLIFEVVRWLFGQGSALHLGPIQACAFGISEPGLSDPDYTLGLSSAMGKLGVAAMLDEHPGLSIGGWPLRTASTGYVRARSVDAREPPEIQPNYLTDEIDQRVVVASLKMARRLLRGPRLSSLVVEEILPRNDVASDDEWLDFARTYGSSGFHFVGSCRMGPATDRMAVVDDQLRVRGIEALRVVDASVMPTMPSGNTNAPTMMIAEKAADMILTLSAHAKPEQVRPS
jgi:choline dehydrogenase